MAFLDSISTFGEIVTTKSTKVGRPKRDPVKSFIAMAEKQMLAIDSDARNTKGVFAGLWFKKEAGGSYIVTLKVGMSPLEKDGKPLKLRCADKNKAIEFIYAASQAAEAGELTEMITALDDAATAAKAKKRQEKADAAAKRLEAVQQAALAQVTVSPAVAAIRARSAASN